MVREPLFWLLLQAGLIALAAWLGGFMSVGTCSDSPLYLGFDLGSLAGVLGGVLTLGYPLLLKAVALASPDQGLLPAVQLALHFLAVFLFWKALTVYGVRPWPALATASPLFYPVPVLRMFYVIASDSAALSLAVMTVAAVVFVAARPRSAGAWLGLTGLLMLTWLTRPAYVLMTAFVPLTGAGLMLLRGALPWRAILSKALPALLVVSLVPLLAFCTLRKATVGHFGLCSYTGLCLSGVAAQLLTEADIPGLPEDVRPLARRIQDERVRRGVAPAVRPEDSIRVLDYERLGAAYDDHLWMICEPVSREMCAGSRQEQDRLLLRYSLAAFRAKPGPYALWLVQAFGNCVGQPLAISLCPPLALALVGSWALIAILRRRRPGAAGPSAQAAADGGVSPLGPVALIGVTFFLLNFAVCVAVARPLMRYTLAAGAFLPSVLAVALFVVWARFLAEQRAGSPVNSSSGRAR